MPLGPPPAMEDERLLHIKEVSHRYTTCCMMLESVQTAHVMIEKACQQAQQITWMPRPVRMQLEQSRKQYESLLQAVLNYKNQLIQEVEYAQRELLTPVIYTRDESTASDENEEQRDIRANIFPDWTDW